MEDCRTVLTQVYVPRQELERIVVPEAIAEYLRSIDKMD